MSLVSLVAALVVTGQEAPPLPPVLPGRPPPLAPGLAHLGWLGQGCRDVRGEDGRWRWETTVSLAPGQTLGLNVSSPDFDPVLEVLDAGGAVIERVRGAAGDAGGGALRFTAPGAPSREFLPPVEFRLRVTTTAPDVVGRWRLEVMTDGRTDAVFPGEAWWPEPPSRCGA